MGMTGDRYGEVWAASYDTLYGDREDLTPIVELVRRYARPATVCEFGVGTGRVAIPLAAAGLAVHGLDNSPAMLEHLHAKPGGELVETSLADMTAPKLDRRFGCVLAAFSTIFLLPDQRAQRRCVQGAADLLVPGGALIVEGFIPDPTRWHNGYSLAVSTWDGGTLRYTVGRIDPAAQVIETMRVEHTPDGPRELSNRMRYLLPSELDLLAESAGLDRVDQFADYSGTPLGPRATDYVAVYRKPGGSGPA